MESIEASDVAFAERAGAYAETHDIYGLLSSLMTTLVEKQPSDPLAGLLGALEGESSGTRVLLLGHESALLSATAAAVASALGVGVVSMRHVLASNGALASTTAAFSSVPDQVVVDAALAVTTAPGSRLSSEGFVLHGAPLSRMQALSMQAQGILPDAVVLCSPSKNDPDTLAALADPDSPEAAYARALPHLLDVYAPSLKRVTLPVPEENEALAVAASAGAARILDAIGRPVSVPSRSRSQVLIVGPPGGGVSSAAAAVAAAGNLVHIDPRKLLRAEVARDSPLGAKAAPFVDDAVLPAEMVIEAVLSALRSPDVLARGWVLEGDHIDELALDELQAASLAPHRAFFLDVSDASVAARIDPLRIDPLDGKIWHTKTEAVPPPVASRLLPLPEYDPEFMALRRAHFTSITRPLLSALAPILQVIDGALPAVNVAELIIAALAAPIPERVRAAAARTASSSSSSKLLPNQAPTPSSGSMSLRSPRKPRKTRPVNLTASSNTDKDDDNDDAAEADTSHTSLTTTTTATPGATTTGSPETAEEEGVGGLKICVVGPPGSGKTTQAQLLAGELGLVHIRPHALLASEVERKTPLGLRALPYVDAVRMPDDVLLDVILQRVNASDLASGNKGWVLDGYPETEWMAEKLHTAGVSVNRYVCLDVSDDAALERLLGRVVDPETRMIYHTSFHPPPGGPVANRVATFEEDEEEMISSRLQHYHDHSQGSHDFHSDLFVHVSGEGSIDDVASRVRDAASTPVSVAPQSSVLSDLYSQGLLRLLVVGPPASGATTQAAVLADKLSVGLISPRLVLEEQAASRTQLGLKARPYLDAPIVPDELLREAVLLRLKDEDTQYGWVLDGYPSDKAGAVALAQSDIRPHRVIVLEASDSYLSRRARLDGRDADDHLAALGRYRQAFPELETFFSKITIRIDATADAGTVSDMVEDALTESNPASKFKLLVVGPPASSAHRLASKLAESHGVPLVEPTDVLAAEMTASTPLGLRAAPYAPSKVFPPALLDAAMVTKLRSPDAENGFILDNYPNDARGLSALASAQDAGASAVDAIIVVDLSDELVREKAAAAAALPGGSPLDERDLVSYRSNLVDLVDSFAAGNRVYRVDGSAPLAHQVHAVEVALHAQ